MYGYARRHLRQQRWHTARPALVEAVAVNISARRTVSPLESAKDVTRHVLAPLEFWPPNGLAADGLGQPPAGLRAERRRLHALDLHVFLVRSQRVQLATFSWSQTQTSSTNFVCNATSARNMLMDVKTTTMPSSEMSDWMQ